MSYLSLFIISLILLLFLFISVCHFNRKINNKIYNQESLYFGHINSAASLQSYNTHYILSVLMTHCRKVKLKGEVKIIGVLVLMLTKRCSNGKSSETFTIEILFPYIPNPRNDFSIIS